MFVQLRTIVVAKGHADKVIERFGTPGYIDGREGLIDITVLENRRHGKESEELIVMIRWASEDAWKAWEKDPVHIEGHRTSRGQERPAYILESSVQMYHARAYKQGLHSRGE